MSFKSVVISAVLIVVVSFYLFPISFTFFPEGLNTKMLLAVVGGVAFAFKCIMERNVSISWTTCVSAFLAVLFSLWCLFAITENATDDTVYSRYWLSFATWLGGAYGVCFLIRKMTGRIDLERLTFYLTLVCVVQCLLALVIDSTPSLASFIDRYVVQGQDFVRDVDRLYGIGASLDTAGVRFSVVLVLIAHQLSRYGEAMQSSAWAIFYLVAFAFIVVLGSIIARTTWVGALSGALYMIISNGIIMRRGMASRKQIYYWALLLTTILISVGVSIYYYNHDPAFRSYLRFGFEGFFNWAEKGVFRTDSTDKLNRIMWVWPKDTRSWIIGTGLFENWIYGTDIGYCRLTLYCGLVGMVLFSFFFVFNGIAINFKLEKVWWLSIFLIALTFIIWVKVSTDIFFIYALLFCLNPPFRETGPQDTSSLEHDVLRER